MIALWLLGCVCRTAEPDVRSVDRTTVRSSTCFADDQGFRVELELSAASQVDGRLLRPGAAPEPLRGRREGRRIHFGIGSAELLGRSLNWEGPNGRRQLERVGCDGQ